MVFDPLANRAWVLSLPDDCQDVDASLADQTPEKTYWTLLPAMDVGA